jgi:acyl-CoA synthetase (AMP-forming)/AMP-acid ligase II
VLEENVMIELASLMSRHSRYRSEASAVVFEDHRLTWRDFAARVAQAGHLLRGLGIAPGDKVATLSGNLLELLEVYWAVPTIGAVLVPLSPLLLSPGVASLLAGSGARCLVVQASLLPVLESIRDRLPPHVIVIGAPAGDFVDYVAATAALPTVIEPAVVDDDTLYNIMFTSGTTGEPKGIMHSHRVRAMYGALMATAFRMTPESRTLHTGAIVFNGAFVMLMPTFFVGATYVLHRQFEPGDVLRTVAAEAITHMMMVPAQIVALLNSPEFDPKRL